MIAWWESLSITEQIFAIVAIPSTVILLIQTLLLIFGLGGHDASADSDVSGLHDGMGDMDASADFDTSFDAHGIGADIHTDHMDWSTHSAADVHDGNQNLDHHDPAEGPIDHGLRLFTVRGFIAFFTIFGWSGLACLQANISKPITFIIAFAAGILSMTVMAWILKVSMKLAFNGTTDLANAVGKSATVYIRVPQKRSGRGKVNVLVQEQYIEADAVTDEKFDLMPGSEAVVVGLTAPTTLLVMGRNK